MNTETKLSPGQKHIIKLVAQDSGPDGWTVVSKAVYPLVANTLPQELVELEPVGTEGRARARLTPEGQNILSAMEWL